MRELVIAQLLIVVDIRLLQHLPPHLLGFLLGQLALGEQFEGLTGRDIDIYLSLSRINLLNISNSNVFISIEIVDGEGIVKFDVPGSVFTHAGEQQHQLIEGEVALAVS